MQLCLFVLIAMFSTCTYLFGEENLEQI